MQYDSNTYIPKTLQKYTVQKLNYTNFDQKIAKSINKALILNNEQYFRDILIKIEVYWRNLYHARVDIPLDLFKEKLIRASITVNRCSLDGRLVYLISLHDYKNYYVRYLPMIDSISIFFLEPKQKNDEGYYVQTDKDECGFLIINGLCKYYFKNPITDLWSFTNRLEDLDYATTKRRNFLQTIGYNNIDENDKKSLAEIMSTNDTENNKQQKVDKFLINKARIKIESEDLQHTDEKEELEKYDNVINSIQDYLTRHDMPYDNNMKYKCLNDNYLEFNIICQIDKIDNIIKLLNDIVYLNYYSLFDYINKSIKLTSARKKYLYDIIPKPLMDIYIYKINNENKKCSKDEYIKFNTYENKRKIIAMLADDNNKDRINVFEKSAICRFHKFEQEMNEQEMNEQKMNKRLNNDEIINATTKRKCTNCGNNNNN